jgi:hypothetical protein
MPAQPHDTSVKHFRHEAKALLRALEAGNAEAARPEQLAPAPEKELPAGGDAAIITAT